MTTTTSAALLAKISQMQERQLSWGRPERSNSTGSASSVGSETSPHMLGLSSVAHQGVGSSTNASAATSIAGGSGRGRPKGKGKSKAEKEGEHKARKKVAKACLACQKSHLTCDEQRPCTRCVKKGMADQCVEGVRKKAKYLLEGEDRIASQPHQPASTSTSPREDSYALLPNVSLSQQQPIVEPPRLPDDVWLAPPLGQETQPSIAAGMAWNGQTQNGSDMTMDSLTYGGTAANSEYRMLDSLFGNISPVFQSMDPLDEAGRQMSLESNIGSGHTSTLTQFDSSWLGPSPGSNVTPGYNMITPGSSGIPPSLSPGTFPELSPNNPTGPWSGWQGDNSQVMLDGASATNESDPGQGDRLLPSQLRRVGKGLTSSEVYRTVVRPYDYTQGYHILMDYLSKNFEQADVLRVVRSLATFRPSLIALQMTMSEEDEVFLERSFQRNLIELEKLISYSATPTAVWRRTGEVCYANPEFCKLIDRTDADLLVKKTYIYELFSKPSVIQYWENFSLHAFENTTPNFFQPVNFTKNGSTLNCTCCFTIRRDVFDLPSVIIGQFLPIPLETS